jgi:hypothetical protein
MHESRGLSGLRDDGRVDSGFRLNPSQSLALGGISAVTIINSGSITWILAKSPGMDVLRSARRATCGWHDGLWLLGRCIGN